jgi:hypothetical protein
VLDALRAALASFYEAERLFYAQPTVCALDLCDRARESLAFAASELERVRGVNHPDTVRRFVLEHPQGVQWARDLASSARTA